MSIKNANGILARKSQSVLNMKKENYFYSLGSNNELSKESDRI